MLGCIQPDAWPPKPLASSAVQKLPHTPQATAHSTKYRTLQKLPHTPQATAHSTSYRTVHKLPHTPQATAQSTSYRRQAPGAGVCRIGCNSLMVGCSSLVEMHVNVFAPVSVACMLCVLNNPLYRTNRGPPHGHSESHWTRSFPTGRPMSLSRCLTAPAFVLKTSSLCASARSHPMISLHLGVSIFVQLVTTRPGLPPTVPCREHRS